MATIIFTVLCLMGCGFMVYVLVQWTRDTQPKVGSRHKDNQAGGRKQLYIVASHKTARPVGALEFRQKGSWSTGSKVKDT